MIPNMTEDADQSRILLFRVFRISDYIVQSLRRVKLKYSDYAETVNIHHLYYIVKRTET